MAVNAASHNAPGQKTGPNTGSPPPASDETKSALLNAANAEPTGQTAPGRDSVAMNAGKSEEKVRKEKEKEAQKAAKLAKLEAKKAKQAEQQNKEGSKKEKKKETSNQPNIADYVEETPRGHKKILKSLDDDFHKAAHPKVIESAWAEWWEREGYFQPQFDNDGNVKKKGKFVIVIPPPNVTGALHCGHALATALQDTMIRWNRMRGLTTLYVPGCDHAGIATQTVVEKMLWRREKKTRHDLGRQAFIARTQEWKEDYHQRINNVFRRLGGSMDWTREAFTMSPQLSRAVTETFVQLHDEGYIYRSNRLVNWCCRLNTALSNIEVDNKELAGITKLDVPGFDRKIEFGAITYFKYPIQNSDKTIEVATTRPETMLGDTGIAVHPDDPRYKDLVGKVAVHPLIPGRLLPIVADTYVEMEFGTGAVKLTPAHDQNDFELGNRHNLQFINILNDDGTLNQNTGSYAGQRRFDARYSVVQALEQKGLYVKKEPNPMTVPICSRSGDVIEPLMKPQWWLKAQPMTSNAVDAVKDGRIKIKPESAEKYYYDWMSKPQDWCLSRQLWWGHQIPAWRVTFDGASADAEETWVTARNEEEAEVRAAKKFSGQKYSLQRDEDVLDTWFSSGLWPFSTLGWPDKTPDFEKLFPTSVLETGWDIVPFWVSRMIMLSLKMTGQVPFTEVYCHSLIRDSEGRKMSKSLGNVIDPLDIVEGISLQGLHQKLREGNLDPKEVQNAERYQKTAFPKGITECGADALRFWLNDSTGGGDININVAALETYRKFTNKIYQATKYVLGKLPDNYTPPASGKPTGKESLTEKWILHKLTTAAHDINKALDDRQFSRATERTYGFFQHHLCDVFIENSKAIIAEGTPEEQKSALDTLYTALEGGLVFFHPFMPFLTEELWQRLPRRPGDKTPSVMLATYPQYDPSFENAKAAQEYQLVTDCAEAIRKLFEATNVREAEVAYVQPFDSTTRETANAQELAIRKLSSTSGRTLKKVTILNLNADSPKGCLVRPVGTRAALWLYVEGQINPAAETSKAETHVKKVRQDATEQEKAVAEILKADTASPKAKDQAHDKLNELRAEEKALVRMLDSLRLMQ